MKSNLIIVSGYFNPLHKGHLEYFKKAKSHGNKLFVIVNNDNQRKLKGSKKFMDEDERVMIINELEITDKVFLSIDDNRSVSSTIEKIHSIYSAKYDLFFANGGDQDNDIPEAKICNKLNIKLINGLGDKIQSSSLILNEEK